MIRVPPPALLPDCSQTVRQNGSFPAAPTNICPLPPLSLVSEAQALLLTPRPPTLSDDLPPQSTSTGSESCRTFSLSPIFSSVNEEPHPMQHQQVPFSTALTNDTAYTESRSVRETSGQLSLGTFGRDSPHTASLLNSVSTAAFLSGPVSGCSRGGSGVQPYVCSLGPISGTSLPYGSPPLSAGIDGTLLESSPWGTAMSGPGVLSAVRAAGGRMNKIDWDIRSCVFV